MGKTGLGKFELSILRLVLGCGFQFVSRDFRELRVTLEWCNLWDTGISILFLETWPSGGLNNRHLFLTFWRLGNLRSRCQQIADCHFMSWGAGRDRDRYLVSSSVYIPKARSPDSITLGIWASTCEFWGTQNIVTFRTSREERCCGVMVMVSYMFIAP